MLVRQAYDNIGRPSECDSSGRQMYLTPPSAVRPYGVLRGLLTPLLFCCETFRSATGAPTALHLAFRSFSPPPPFLSRFF